MSVDGQQEDREAGLGKTSHAATNSVIHFIFDSFDQTQFSAIVNFYNKEI